MFLRTSPPQYIVHHVPAPGRRWSSQDGPTIFEGVRHACMHARAHIIIHHSTGRSKVAPEKSTQGGPAFQLGESRVGLNIDRS